MKKAFLLLLAAAALPFVASPALGEGCTDGNARLTWDSGLMLRSIADVGARLDEMTLAPDLRRGPLRGIATCRDFLTRGGARLDPDALEEWNWEGAGDLGQNFFIRDCLALGILAKAQPARRDCVKGFRFTKRSADDLPSTTALIGAGQTPETRGMAETKSLREWDPSIRVTADSPTELTAIGRDYNGYVLLGAGDFNSDGYQDLIVAMRHNSRDGGYREWRLGVLSRNDGSGVLSHRAIGSLKLDER